MKLHLLVGIFALLFIVGAVVYVAVAPPPPAAEIKYPGEPISGEPIETATGVKYYEMTVGTGEAIPSETSTVRVKYAGYLMNGTKFDGNDSMSFVFNQVIKGWPDGMKDMKVGSKRKLIIPPERAYGFQRHGNIPAGSTLVFDVELLGIEPDAPEIPGAPPRLKSKLVIP
jgi:hypothetical protein